MILGVFIRDAFHRSQVIAMQVLDRVVFDVQIINGLDMQHATTDTAFLHGLVVRVACIRQQLFKNT